MKDITQQEGGTSEDLYDTTPEPESDGHIDDCPDIKEKIKEQEASRIIIEHPFDENSDAKEVNGFVMGVSAIMSYIRDVTDMKYDIDSLELLSSVGDLHTELSLLHCKIKTKTKDSLKNEIKNIYEDYIGG